MDDDPVIIKLVTIICLAVIILAAVVGLMVVAITTDRDLRVAEGFTFAGVILLTGLGGLSWVSARRRRKRHLHIDLGNNHDIDT